MTNDDCPCEDYTDCEVKLKETEQELYTVEAERDKMRELLEHIEWEWGKMNK